MFVSGLFCDILQILQMSKMVIWNKASTLETVNSHDYCSVIGVEGVVIVTEL